MNLVRNKILQSKSADSFMNRISNEMKKYDQVGAVTTVMISLVLLILLLVASLGFGYWAYSSRQDYKENSDKKVAAAVAKAKQEQIAADSADFAEKEKLPNKDFNGPATYGSVSFSYPKTWSAYVDQTKATNPVEGYFYPNIVPAAGNYALRVELVGMSYSQVMKQFSTFIKKGTLRAKAYVPPKMKQIPNVQTGTRLDGQIEKDVQGSMVVIKVRDKTLKIYTESPKYRSDFDKIVLNSLTFVP